MVKYFSSRVPSPYNGERTVFLRNGARKIEYIFIKNKVGFLYYIVDSK